MKPFADFCTRKGIEMRTREDAVLVDNSFWTSEAYIPGSFRHAGAVGTSVDVSWKNGVLTLSHWDHRRSGGPVRTHDQQIPCDRDEADAAACWALAGAAKL